MKSVHLRINTGIRVRGRLGYGGKKSFRKGKGRHTVHKYTYIHRCVFLHTCVMSVYTHVDYWVPINTQSSVLNVAEHVCSLLEKKNLHRQNMPKSIEYYHNIIFTSCTETALIGCWLSRLPVRLNGTKAFYG